MANRRCFNALNRHFTSLLSSNALHQCVKSLPLIDAIAQTDSFAIGDSTSNNPLIRRNFESLSCVQSESVRHFSSRRRNPGEQDEENEDSDDYEDDDEDDEEEEDEDEEGEIGENSDEDGDHSSRSVSNRVVNRVYSTEEKEMEANAIGYKVIGPLDPSERPFKPWEPVFAVVQIGSHQFKVSNGDIIYTERLKYCEVNDKLILNRVLMVGSSNQTIIGRPILPDAAVHAVVEEHALDAKVIIFKKKRRKNYRRTKGHRQELTSLRITDIQGIEKPAKVAVRKPEKEAVAA